MSLFIFRKIYQYRQIVRYVISGGTAAVVNLALLYFFTDILGIWYLISASLAFGIAFFVSFFLQKFWTFRDRNSEKIGGQAFFYFAVAILNLGVNAGLVYFFVDITHIWYMLAQILSSGLIAVESFLIYKFIIFKKALEPAPEELLSGNPGKVKNILIATGIYPPDFRGPATILEALPAALRERGFEVRVVTYSDIAVMPEEQGSVYRILRDQPLWKKYLKYFWQLYRLAEWADLIYVTDIYSVGYFAYLISKISGKKYVVRFAGDSAWETASARGWADDYIVDFQKKTYNRQIEEMKARRAKILINADCVIAVSNFMADLAQLISVDKGKIKVVYNSIDFIDEHAVNLEKVEAIKKRFGQSAKIIVTSGQLVPWKGMAALIEILPELAQNVGLVNLLVLGEGQELENLKKLAESLSVTERTHFLGKIDHQEILNYFKAADLYVLNTNYEGLSHTLLEVMKVGTPIVTTNIGGNPEVINDNENGLLVPYNDKSAWLAAIERLFKDEFLRQRFSTNAKKTLDKFSWSQLVAKTIDVFEGLYT